MAKDPKIFKTTMEEKKVVSKHAPGYAGQVKLST